MGPAFQAVHAADKVFGSETNGKGYKVIRGCGVIQGDGIDITMLHKISDAVLAAGALRQSRSIAERASPTLTD